MSGPSYLICLQQTLCVEPSDKVSGYGHLPVEWNIKVSIENDFRASFYCRDADLFASVVYGSRLTYWSVNRSDGVLLRTYADGTCASAQQALQDATDAMARARADRMKRRAAQAVAT